MDYKHVRVAVSQSVSQSVAVLIFGFFLYTPYVHTMIPLCGALRQPFTQVYKLSENIRHLRTMPTNKEVFLCGL